MVKIHKEEKEKNEPDYEKYADIGSLWKDRTGAVYMLVKHYSDNEKGIIKTMYSAVRLGGVSSWDIPSHRAVDAVHGLEPYFGQVTITHTR
jgi:hypothetical protein